MFKYRKLLSALAVTLVLIGGCSSNDEKGDPPPVAEKSVDWARRAVFYQVFVRSFYDSNADGIGDLGGLAGKLDYLKGLGVDALWLMPIHPGPTYHGYSVSDYRAVHPDYGTVEDFKGLIRDAHQREMKVVIDWVVNHTSNEHEWFKKALAGDADYEGFYLWSDTRVNDNWVQASNGKWYLGWYGNPHMAELNYANPKVREAVKQIAKFWLDLGVDGFRLDVAQNIGDGDNALTYGWWKEFNAYVKAANPAAYVVGEVNYDSLNANTQHAPFYQGMDSTFNFPAYNYLLGMSTGLTRDILGALNAAHDEYALYNSRYIDATTLGNHDRSRIASRLKFDAKQMRHAVTLLMTLPGTPFLYYGEEIGMGGGHDQQADANKREPFDWYASAAGQGMVSMTKAVYGKDSANTLAYDGISLEEQEGDANSIFNVYKTLIALRKRHPMLFDGRYQRIGTPDDTYGYKVSAPGTDYALYVIHNQSILTQKSLTLTGEVEDLLSGKRYGKGQTIVIPEFGSVVLKAAVADGLPIDPMPIVNQENPSYTMTFLLHTPDRTPADSSVYMPNSDDGWDPNVIRNCAGCTLSKVGDNLYRITLERERGTILEYKYFRELGWDSSESDSLGDWNGNREAVFARPDAVVEDTVIGWRDTHLPQ